ncbi:hypothetical protein [Azospirillum sp. sgz301742]
MDDIRKTCTKCGVDKPLDDYPLSKKGPFGRASACKDCKNVQARHRYLRLSPAEKQKRSEQAQAWQRAWQERDPDGYREYHREYRRQNPEAACEHFHRYREKLKATADDQ